MVLAGIGLLSGQTQLDLRTQTRNVDFSQAISVRPFPTGTVLPNTCVTGQMFFKSNTAAGANLYACVGLNVWVSVPQSSGSGDGTSATAPFDFQISGALLTIGTTCTIENPCRALIGSTVYSYPAAATATLTGGSGAAYVYLDLLGVLTVGYGGGMSQNNQIACSGCTAVFNVNSFPETGFPIGGAGALINSTEVRLPPPTLPFFGDTLSFVLFHDMGNVFTSAGDAWASALRVEQPDRDACRVLTPPTPQPAPKPPIPPSPTGPITSTGQQGQCSFNYFSHAAGMGMRYHTPVGPIRLDFSYNLNPPIYPVNVNYSQSDIYANQHVGEAAHFNFFFSLGQTF